MTKPSDLIAGRTVYIVGGGSEYANWCQAREVETMEEATFVLFTGGSDVHPSLYGKRPHPSAYHSLNRDIEETEEFKKALRLDKPMLGICRGSQFMCVCAGGLLVQDQPNPYYMHMIETIDGKEIAVSSTHHQAQWPWNLPSDDYSVIGWSREMSSWHWGERDGDEMVIGKAPDDKECEIVHYRRTKALAIQSHPEGVFIDYAKSGRARESTDYMRSLLDRLIANTL